MRIETVNTGAFDVDFFKFGHGQRTLVILPGLSVQSVTLSADAIEKAYRPFGNDFTVYVFDRRKDLPPVYTIDEMANDAAEAITAAGIGRACIFGASQGAMMAMKIAARLPELVEKLVIASAAERITDENRAVIDEWIKLAEEENAKKLYLSFGKAVYPHDVFEKLSGFLDEAANSVTPEELKRFIISAKAAKGFDAVKELESIVCPTLVVGDTDDRVFGGGAANAIFKRMNKNPDAELCVYSGYGHACYDTVPDFKERLLRFLK